MPNGGSDCCGTCWFNARNEGRAGHAPADSPIPNRCRIRSLEIEDAFYTYCTNHPYRRPGGDPIPIGPVFVVDYKWDRKTPPGPPLIEPVSYGRKIWQASPDGEEIRLHLLELVHEIREMPSEEYDSGFYADEVVVWQLGQFREARAVPDLRRILGFSPAAATPGPHPRTRQTLIATALEAVGAIESPESAKP